MTNRTLTYKEQLAAIGLEEYECYQAEVISTDLHGSYFAIDELGITSFVPGYYPIGTRIFVSFNISNSKKTAYAVVEWVSEYSTAA